MADFFARLSSYKSLFLILFEICIVVVLGFVVYGLVKKWKADMEEARKTENAVKLVNKASKDMGEVERQNTVRQLFAADGVDPNPNSYMGISDGGREVFVRSVTISKLPKKVRYADTLKQLLDFPNCTRTIFVDPIDSEVISRKLDKQINVLESEIYVAEGNPNRIRKLSQQSAKTASWASKVETGDKKFFYVGFLFNLHANSVDELNRLTDDFRGLALNKKIEISNCYGVQSEAYLAGLPINRHGGTVFGKINSDAVKMHLLDQEAASVILDYTTDYFSHKKGIPLGRNLFNNMPFIFDMFEPSHDGYTLVMCGKTNSGKSATIKMIIERTVPLGYRYVIIDSQTRKGTSAGEFASVTEVNGGTNYQISSKGSNVLNIFDVQESVEFVQTGADMGYERRTLDLNGAITDMVYNIRSMMQIGASADDIQLDAVLGSDIDDIVRRAVKELFQEKGIVHGDADSLYERGEVISDGTLQSGVILKKLPIISEFFKKVLLYRKENKDTSLDGAYRLIVNNISEYVRELYYAERSCVFFTREEYNNLPVDETNPMVRLYLNEDDDYERVIALHGIRPYYDGQSTFQISRDCPVTNIDISQLPENERKIAREIATRFMNEQFIKKNSERLEGADKLVGVVDEAHENFEYEYGRKTFANVTRTARKRHVGMIYATQTVVELSRHPETADILRQASMKFIFKQDGKDRDDLVKDLNITPSQANIIVNRLGVVTDKDDPDAKKKHRGEVCIIDGEQVVFVKVDYLVATEKLAVETDASSVIRVMKKG